MFDWFLFYLRRHLWRLLLCCDFLVCFFFPLLHFLDIPLMHATTTCIPNKLLSLQILGLPIQKLSWTFQKLESVLCQPPEANIDTNGYEPSKASNDGKQCQARSLTFHICINLKLKWKPTVEKAYCFRPIQWLDSTVETNEKHRKKWEHDRMGKNQNERTMPLARKWELKKMILYVAFYFHVQWFITIMKLYQLIDLHKQTTVLQEGWLFI